MLTIEKHQKKFAEIKQNFLDNITDDLQELYDLEQNVKREFDMVERYVFENNKYGEVPDSQIRGFKEMQVLKKVLNEIGQFINENNSFNEDSELDMMFPNRQDDNFDEDDISYNNVFGDD